MEVARIGIKVRCIKDDGADEHYGIADELRWHINNIKTLNYEYRQ